MMKHFARLFAVAAVLAFAGHASAAPVLDDFNAPPTPSSPSQRASVVGGAGIGTTFPSMYSLGGIDFTRNLSVQQNNAGNNSLSVSISNGSLDFASSAGAVGSATVTYTFTPNQDFTGATLAFNVIDFDPGTGSNVGFLDVTVGGVLFPQQTISAIGQQIIIPVSGSSVNTVTLQFSGQQGVDFTISPIGSDIVVVQEIPEPASMLLFGGVVVTGGAVYLRRRRKQAVAS